MKNILYILLIVSFVMIGCPKYSYAFRCGNEIVSRWDSAASVIVKCGNPFSKSSGYQKIDGKRIYVEKWYFNCGENDFIYSISIHDGIVVSVDSVERGKGKSNCGN
jgi:hypothetical protein